MPGLVFCWRLMRGGREARVAAAPASTFGQQEALAGGGEIVQLFATFGVIHDGPDRRLQFDRLAFVPRPIAALAMPPALGLVLGIEAEMKAVYSGARWLPDRHRRRARHRRRWAAARDIFLTPKGHAAITAIPAFT